MASSCIKASAAGRVNFNQILTFKNGLEIKAKTIEAMKK